MTSGRMWRSSGLIFVLAAAVAAMDFVSTARAQDVMPPVLVSARANTLTNIEITFSEPVDESTAEDPAHYTVSSPAGAIGVIGADRLNGNDAKVVLTLAAPMPC